MLKLSPSMASGRCATRCNGFGFMVTSSGLSAIAPPWTTLTAYDLNTGTITWKVPLGEVPELAAKGFTPDRRPFSESGPRGDGGRFDLHGHARSGHSSAGRRHRQGAVEGGSRRGARGNTHSLRSERQAVRRLLRGRARNHPHPFHPGAPCVDCADTGRVRRVRVAMKPRSIPLSRREFFALAAGASAIAGGVAARCRLRARDASARLRAPDAACRAGSLVLGRPREPIGRAGAPRPWSRRASRSRRRSASTVLKRGGNAVDAVDRHGRRAQRDRAEHDRRRRRRLHDDLLVQDQETRGTQRQRARAAGAEPRLLHVERESTQMPTDRHGADHRARRVRRLGHAAREARHDEARRICWRRRSSTPRTGFPSMEKIVGRLGPGSAPGSS